MVYPAMLIFLSNLTCIFQGLQAGRDLALLCIRTACALYMNIFPKNIVTSSNLNLGIIPKQQNLDLGTSTSIRVNHSFLCTQN